MDFLFHFLELLRHLVALRDALLELLANVKDHLVSALKLLSGIVSGARCACAGRRSTLLLEVGR